MIELAQGWTLDVQRGPEWLFIRVHRGDGLRQDDCPPLAEAVWAVMEQQFCHRLVLELNDLGLLYSYLVGQLVLLQKRVSTHGGVMRVCGLSDCNQQVMRACRLDQQIPHYADRDQAVWGQRPQRPLHPR